MQYHLQRLCTYGGATYEKKNDTDDITRSGSVSFSGMRIEREIGKISDDRFYEIKQAMANSTKEEEIEALRDMGYSKRRAEKIREKYNKTK